MLQMVTKKVYYIVLLLLLCGCDKVDFKGLVMATGDMVDSRYEQSFELHKGAAVASIAVTDSYLFYVSADAHINDDTSNIKEFANALRNDGNALFGVMLGDCIDKRGSMPLYCDAIDYKADEQKYPLPIFSVIGNHDLFFEGWGHFRNLLGASVYWFETIYDGGKDFFITLDTASGTLGAKQIEWLQEFLASVRGNYRHCIVLTHTNLLYTDNSQVSSGNLPLEETLLLFDIFGKHNVTLCLQGHDHYREDVMFKGVRYTIVGAIRKEFEKAEYLCVRLSDSGVEYEWRYIQ